MTILVDTNVLVRLAAPSDPEYPTATNAVRKLHQAGQVLAVTPQVLIEFRSTATRPITSNGLGLSPVEADRLSADFERMFVLLPDTPDIFPAWKALVHHLGVIGKQVHDARLVAVCQIHLVAQLLTFNVTHFNRLVTPVAGLVALAPGSVR